MGPPRQSGVERYQSIGSASLESRRPAGRHGRTPARRALGARPKVHPRAVSARDLQFSSRQEVELEPNVV
jgi:hypothetical protein